MLQANDPVMPLTTRAVLQNLAHRPRGIRSADGCGQGVRRTRPISPARGRARVARPWCSARSPGTQEACARTELGYDFASQNGLLGLIKLYFERFGGKAWSQGLQVVHRARRRRTGSAQRISRRAQTCFRLRANAFPLDQYAQATAACTRRGVPLDCAGEGSALSRFSARTQRRSGSKVQSLRWNSLFAVRFKEIYGEHRLSWKALHVATFAE
ncbi:hypothetical protein DFH11DRAFT_1642812 [Phellopilus nigrolimitatus]|nr:hypothetical protein DFH11DRAFT_1642812 [Phellopilus nigrolimitatus]